MKQKKQRWFYSWDLPIFRGPSIFLVGRFLIHTQWFKSFSSLEEVCFSSFSYTVSKYNFSDMNSCSYETIDNEYTQFKLPRGRVSSTLPAPVLN